MILTSKRNSLNELKKIKQKNKQKTTNYINISKKMILNYKKMQHSCKKQDFKGKNYELKNVCYSSDAVKR